MKSAAYPQIHSFLCKHIGLVLLIAYFHLLILEMSLYHTVLVQSILALPSLVIKK